MSRADFEVHVKDAREAMAAGRLDAARICARWAGVAVGRDNLDIADPFTEVLLSSGFDEGFRMARRIRESGTAKSGLRHHAGYSAAAMSEPREGEEV